MVCSLEKEYGFWTVISKSDNKPSGYYKCRCICGKIKDIWISTLTSGKSTNCGCQRRGKKRDTTKNIDAAKQYIDSYINGLLILDAKLEKSQNGNKIYFYCLCPCGCKFWTLKTHVLSGNTKTCGHNKKINLEKGKAIMKSASKDGTNAYSIQRKGKNINNKTGYTGVSFMSSTGKYRAYINFKRRQYYLGLYDNIEDAAKVRKIAEKHYFGNFLKWYKQEYPDNYSKISNQ